MSSNNEVNFLKLTLHGTLVGYLAGYRNGRNVLSFVDEFKQDINRPTFSLITYPAFPNSEQVIAKPWVNNQRLHPSLSNLLPEGALREFLAKSWKVHVDHEFQILSYLGDDLPGAIVANVLDPDEVPVNILSQHASAKVIKFDEAFYERRSLENKFSLAGVQMKFSMKVNDGRYNMSKEGALGDWIIKTPSTQHKDVPLNEFSAMTLASMAGVVVPEIRLVELSKLDNLPPINLPEERYAFAIKRFDRNSDQRIHMEDFAQVLVKDPREKYGSANYENIGKVLYEYSGDGLADAQEFARRLLINILLANGDAHLKNWSLLYSDKITPRLSPAYDIVTTSVYIEDERQFALNLNKGKDWYKVNFSHFESWAKRTGIPWRAINPHLQDTLDKARDLWPNGIQDLPMNEGHKKKLRAHWGKLHADFRI